MEYRRLARQPTIVAECAALARDCILNPDIWFEVFEGYNEDQFLSELNGVRGTGGAFSTKPNPSISSRGSDLIPTRTTLVRWRSDTWSPNPPKIWTEDEWTARREALEEEIRVLDMLTKNPKQGDRDGV